MARGIDVSIRDEYDITAHGTDDWKRSNYIKNARALASTWQKNEKKCEEKKEMPPYRNADNIAMSALGK